MIKIRIRFWLNGKKKKEKEIWSKELVLGKIVYQRSGHYMHTRGGFRSVEDWFLYMYIWKYIHIWGISNPTIAEVFEIFFVTRCRSITILILPPE